MVEVGIMRMTAHKFSITLAMLGRVCISVVVLSKILHCNVVVLHVEANLRFSGLSRTLVRMRLSGRKLRMRR